MTRRRERFRQVADLAEIVSAGLDAETVLARVAAAVRALCPAVLCVIRLVDAEAGGYRLVAVDGAAAVPPPPVRPFGTGFTHVVAETRRSLFVRNARADSRAAGADWYSANRVSGYYGVPIQVGETLLGVLGVFFPARAAPTREEREAIDLFTSYGSAAIASARVFAESETRRRTAEALAEASRLLSQSLNPLVVGKWIVGSLRRLCRARMAGLYRVEDSGDLIVVAMSDDAEPSTDWDLDFPAETGMIGLAVRERAPVVCADALSDDRVTFSPEARQLIETSALRAMLAVPLTVKDRVIGALAVRDRAGRIFEAEEIRLAQVFADQAALALQNAQFYEMAAVRSIRLQTLARLNRLVSSSLDTHEVLSGIARAAAELMDAPVVSVWTADETARTLEVRAFSDGRVARDFPDRIVRFNQGGVGWAAVHRRLLHVPDVFEDARMLALDWWRRHGLTSFLALPIMLDDALIGVLALNGRKPFSLSADDRDLLDTFVAQAAVAFRNARLFAREQTAAAASERRFRELVQGLDAIVWETTLAGEGAALTRARPFSFVSQRAEPILGYPVDRWMKTPHFWEGLIHPDDRDIAVTAWRTAASEGRHYELEYRAVAADSRLVWLHEIGRVVRDEVGHVRQLRGLMVDVTERRRGEEALRRSEAHTRAIFQSALDAVITMDHEGRIREFNPAAERMFGHPGGAVIGKELARLLLPPGLRDRHRSGLGRYLATGESAMLGRRQELTALRADGSEFPVELTVTRTDQPGPPVFTGYVRDITGRKQAEEALRARARQQAVVAELGQIALTGTDLASLMQDTVALTAETLGVEYCKVLELLPDGDALVLRAGVGWRVGLVGTARVEAAADSQAGFTLMAKEPVIVEDLRAETRFSGPPLLHDHGVTSGMSVIIPGATRPFGVLGAHTARPRAFTTDDVNFLQAVANVLAAAIERKRVEMALRQSEEELKGLSFKDEVTGLYNRRFFSVRLEEEVRRCVRFKQELSVVLMDLDGFKQVNDEQGHAAGDEVLREIGQLVLRHSRKIDVFARYGGDEFAILLVQTPRAGALFYADRLRQRIAEHPFRIGAHISASFGVASLPDGVSGAPEDLIRAADRALYAAKASGRNAVVSYGGRPGGSCQVE
jgi:diguanylate cyclase (GGDEF)-like protein/PAS domain S-box-containing protein